MGTEKPAQRPSDDELLQELGRELTAVLAIGVVHSENTEAKLAEVAPKERQEILDYVAQEVGIVPVDRPKVTRPPPKIKKGSGKGKG